LTLHANLLGCQIITDLKKHDLSEIILIFAVEMLSMLKTVVLLHFFFFDE